ncbi:AAA family ATPase [Neobacillus sp. CF12]|uniref:AAA family ATPase n=1 Tax=Neobacillus sp. CF12 TaxID=3055864 RepID=UPI0025A2FC3B|nr:AAA family ATPase [Neobacillus sp. CF12]MDM5326284.1 AAA family ATPase [Neobacillus sp. CF12]
MEKEIWKWILETLNDEGIAKIGQSIGAKRPVFRQINPHHKRFKILRPALIQEALHQRNAKILKYFFDEIAEEDGELVSYRGRSIEELLLAAEEEISPSILFSVLMSSEEEEDIEKATEIFRTLRDEDKLEAFENRSEAKVEEVNNPEEETQANQLQEEMKVALQKNVKLDRKIKKLEKNIEELKVKDTVAQNAIKNERKQLKEDKKGLSQDNHSLKKEVDTLKKKVLELTSEKVLQQKQLDKHVNTIKAKEDEISKLHARMLKERTELEKKLASKELETAVANAKVSDKLTFADLLAAEGQVATTIEAPPAKPAASVKKPHDGTEELFMQEFDSVTHELGLVYDKKDLYNFHTAMKSSSLVILAGMSGTGKSKLVQAYGKALGLVDKHQMTFIPVRTAWTDDADLIGYADTLKMVYRPGDSGLINALMSAKENSNKLHIICFDEMNLARVEHYFSQFLSVLENEPGPQRVLQLYNGDLKGKLTNSAQFPPVIPIGDNVIFVGTVNLDESTYHFSDKVLDRANVITLNVLNFGHLRTLSQEKTETTNLKEQGTLSFEAFNILRNQNKEIHMQDHELALLWEVHTELQKVNKNLGAGPRIVRQIDMYLKNLPNSEHFTRAEAFDKQIVQRILTKVRGPEEQLKKFIGTYDLHTENIVNSKLGEILDRYHEVSEFYETRNVLIHKAKELKLNGYTL